ncbi:Transcriptional activator protein UGA3 [Sphaceloma murrayae]|uniref:Transcriptional activator protein UGA3 n=1 Tax=Sphaceloma murrayae TaxID=2082308 RepID=A0A2K1QGR7_9PEZI|nr:Transcriptional activator protein UGA3 [Sphaceloma murrayae]
MATRKPHKKSHHGCRECKRRRIKCDETHPTCVACTTRGTTCSYNSFNIVQVSTLVKRAERRKTSGKNQIAATPTTAASNHQSPTSVSETSAQDEDASLPAKSLDDLRLLQHWIRHVYSTIFVIQDLDEIFRSTVVDEGFKNPFLLHGILALAALHGEHYGMLPPTVSGASWGSVATSHYAAALPLYRSALASISDDNCSAIFMFSILAAVICIGLSDRHTDSAVSDLLESCKLWRGVFSVSQHVLEMIRSGPFAGMTGRHVPYHAKNPPEQGVRLGLILRERLERVSDEDYPAYEKLIDSIELRFSFEYLPPLEIVRWLCLFEKAEVDLLEKRTDLGDAMLAAIGIILHNLDGYWWAKGYGVALARAVVQGLGEDYSELKLLVAQLVERPAPEVLRDTNSWPKLESMSGM